MSENDNLQEAEGKKEVEVLDATPKEETKTEVSEDATNSSENDSETKEEHVDEIEASNAEDAEDESNAERHEVEEKDYHAMTLDQLVTEFNRLLNHHKIQTISKHVNQIKAEFNSKFSTLLDEKKEESFCLIQEG